MSGRGVLITIIGLYTIWALYSGYKFMSGRVAWLEEKKPLNVAVKLLLSLIVGYVIAVFYLILILLRFLGIIGS